jgi:shikimate kinase/3-dehydroquinate synthase
MQDVRRVVLTGFSGSGKSTVALLLAARLGWRPIDNDQDIEIETGLTIPEIFAQQGEAPFRQLERQHLLRALDRDRVVIATGGGACVDEALWTDQLLYKPGTLVITLDAHPDEMLARMKRQAEMQGNGADRPMLAGDNPLARIAELKRTRQEAYDRSHVTLPVDRMEADHVADEIMQMVRPSLLEPCVRMKAASGSTAVHIGPGATDFAGELIKETYPRAQRTWIISDANVDALHGKDIETTLLAFGLRPERVAVASGEGSKSLATAGMLYDWMLRGGIERGDVVVALGGGVVGDLAGFVAATVLRGVGLVQIPTTLLSTVDSSIGGKTAINHETGKNLIGAFYQPPLVVIDTRFLVTLPPRELRSGFGEIVKHAIVQPSTPNGERADLVRFLERNAHNLRLLSEPVTSYMISRNIELKAAVVENDERETGIRAFLNFGHTLGHAIEAAGYRLLHGEAVAVGMRAAMRIGRDMGTATDLHVQTVDALLDLYGLPKRAPVEPERVMELLGSDKKRKAGRLRWILPLQDGGVTLSEDVPIEIVREALSEVIDRGA